MRDIVNELREERRILDGMCEVDHALLSRAADEIEWLRAIVGAASVGPGFAELAASLPKRDPHPER